MKTKRHAPPDYQCPFCAIVRGEERADVATKQEDVVLTTPEVTAFISSHQWPNNPGHVIVIPNKHLENLYTLPDDLAIPLQSTVQSIALALKTAYDCPGISTRQHNEPAGGQDVWHYHIHVFPRYPEDNLYGTRRQRTTPEQRRIQAQAIRRALEQNGT
jgi:histidine triad (HIT) family protein